MGEWLATHAGERPLVGIWPGSRKLERRWPVGHYARLARSLINQRSASVVVLWGPGEERLRDDLVAAAGSASLPAPATDLDDLAGLLRNLDLLVTNDTGPMHLSVAVGTPTVCLFATGDPVRWGHPYLHVRNLKTPNISAEEADEVAVACQELLDRH
jgi:ADP-heptose:LPS heptosyltransferase